MFQTAAQLGANRRFALPSDQMWSAHMVYDRLMPPKELTLAQIQDIVRRNAISEFLDAFESEFIDFKSEIYRLDEDSQKLELAKDISALANSSGGFIVLGIKTTKLPEFSADVATELRPIPRNLFNKEQYESIARDGIYPPLNELQICLIDSADSPGKAFVFIERRDEETVPAASRDRRQQRPRQANSIRLRRKGP
jgi:hypothetical protein